MEDCILTMNNFNKESYRHLFCVFDGHGGNLTAKLCVKRFPEIFRKCLLENPFDYELAIKKSFTLMDKEIEKMDAKEVGNTGTVIFINNKLLFCANVGDSSCCLIGKNIAEFITIDDKCSNKKVWDTLNPEDISKIIFANKDNNFNNIAKIIVDTAQERGSEDNISCIVVELNKKFL